MKELKVWFASAVYAGMATLYAVGLEVVIVTFPVGWLGVLFGWGAFSNKNLIDVSCAALPVKVILPPWVSDIGYKSALSFAKPAHASAPDGKVYTSPTLVALANAPVKSGPDNIFIDPVITLETVAALNGALDVCSKWLSITKL